MTDGSGVMLMVGVSLPIWRSRLRAGVAEAEAMRDMASAELEAMRRMVEGQAAVAFNQVDAAQSRLPSRCATMYCRGRATRSTPRWPRTRPARAPRQRARGRAGPVGHPVGLD